MRSNWGAFAAMSATGAGFTAVAVVLSWLMGTPPFFAAFVLVVILPLVYPLVAVSVQWWVVGRQHLTLPIWQIITYSLMAPVCFVAIGLVESPIDHGNLDLGERLLMTTPTLLLVSIQGFWLRHRARGSQNFIGYLIAAGLSAVSALFGILFWLALGTQGSTRAQLRPDAEQLVAWLATMFSIATIFLLVAAYLVAQHAKHSPAHSLGRWAVTIAGAVCAVLVARFGLTAIVAVTPEEEFSDGRTFHRQILGPLLMVRERTSDTPQPGTPTPPGTPATPETPTPPGTPALPETPAPPELPSTQEVIEQQIVGQAGPVAVAQTGASLGQKGRFSAVRKEDGRWQYGDEIATDVSFVDIVEMQGLVLASFSPDPLTNMVASLDGGQTWQRLLLDDSAVPEDARYFQSLDFENGQWSLSVGYPEWVGSTEAWVWTSADGENWEGPTGP